MVTVDISDLFLFNVTDTCSIWNILSSKLLYSAACSAKIIFCCTKFVHYECLYKTRKRVTEEDTELQNRLRQEIKKGVFQAYDLSIEDLQDLEVLENRMKLGKGELSSIVFAKKTRQAFLTDDYKGGARQLAQIVMGIQMVQTTPQIFGWLYFTSQLGDSDKDKIIEEHKKLKRPLALQFEVMYQEALRCRLMENFAGNNTP